MNKVQIIKDFQKNDRELHYSHLVYLEDKMGGSSLEESDCVAYTEYIHSHLLPIPREYDDDEDFKRITGLYEGEFYDKAQEIYLELYNKFIEVFFYKDGSYLIIKLGSESSSSDLLNLITFLRREYPRTRRFLLNKRKMNEIK